MCRVCRRNGYGTWLRMDKDGRIGECFRVCQDTYVERVQSMKAAEVLIEEIRRLLVDGSAGIQIALVPFLSNADPLKTWRASFEAQRGNRVRPGRFWPSSPNVSVYHLYHPSPSPSQPPSSSSPLSHTRSLPPSIFPSPDFHAACPTPSSIYYYLSSLPSRHN